MTPGLTVPILPLLMVLAPLTVAAVPPEHGPSIRQESSERASTPAGPIIIDPDYPHSFRYTSGERTSKSPNIRLHAAMASNLSTAPAQPILDL